MVLNSFRVPQEGIRHEEPNTTVYINAKEIGKGTLYVTESLLSWVDNVSKQGFSLEYPHISLHAVARNEQLYPRQCLYIMVDSQVDIPNLPVVLPNESDSDKDDEDEEWREPRITEMQFAPDNTNNLDVMFQAMNLCQALNPDLEDFSDEDIYEDAEEDNEGEYDEEVGAGDAPCILSTGEQMENIHTGTETEEAMDIEAGQFEDAEEDP